MTDHLPECDEQLMCICGPLRSCEQRVIATIRRDSWFEDGLDSARKAVSALEPLLHIDKSDGGYDCCGCTTPSTLLEDALSAIDALRLPAKP